MLDKQTPEIDVYDSVKLLQQHLTAYYTSTDTTAEESQAIMTDDDDFDAISTSIMDRVTANHAHLFNYVPQTLPTSQKRYDRSKAGLALQVKPAKPITQRRATTTTTLAVTYESLVQRVQPNINTNGDNNYNGNSSNFTTNTQPNQTQSRNGVGLSRFSSFESINSYNTSERNAPPSSPFFDNSSQRDRDKLANRTVPQETSWQALKKRMSDLPFEESYDEQVPGIAYCTDSAVDESLMLDEVQQKHIGISNECGTGLLPSRESSFGQSSASAAISSSSFASSTKTRKPDGGGGGSGVALMQDTDVGASVFRVVSVDQTKTKKAKSERELQKLTLKQIIKDQVKTHLAHLSGGDAREVYTRLFKLCDLFTKMCTTITTQEEYREKVLEYLDKNLVLVESTL
eukprot:m.217258 g.217258  ORF g.217258 m.217258 type:complete len:401 (+) comp33233_c10_seq1:488-1690(+)